MGTYAIGDVHGCLPALKTVFGQGFFDEGDTVIFLGDYVDRGVDSKGVIDYVIDRNRQFNLTFIQGNHEIMMLTAKNHASRLDEWLFFGGQETLLSYGALGKKDWVDKVDDSHWSFLENCRPYAEVGDFIFVHAGLEKGKALEEQNRHHLFWHKYETPNIYVEGKTVICGHTSRRNGEIANFGHTICIDTYAYGGMWLTCLDVETRRYLKANNDGEYVVGVL